MKPKILVVGDVMLDRYIHGVVERISPEAPIPILRQTHVEDRPGGAANVAMNLASLGAEVVLGGSLGADSAGSSLATHLTQAGVGGLRVPLCASTTVKSRYVSMGQQMLRTDQEGERPNKKTLDFIDRAVLDVVVKGCAALVLSDYAGGVLDRAQNLIAPARMESTPVYVDPKGTDWERYRGATLIKPNEAELLAMVGACNGAEMLVRGAKLLRELGIDQMLVTHGAGGMTWLNQFGEYSHQSALSGPVVDVTGAGDTVLAVVAYLLALKRPWVEVLPMAAKAAAAVCARHGTSVVTAEDLGMDHAVAKAVWQAKELQAMARRAHMA